MEPPPSSDRMFEQPPFLAFSIDRILSPDFGRPKKPKVVGRSKGSFGFIEDELQMILERLRNVEGQRWSTDSPTLSPHATRSLDSPPCSSLSPTLSPRLNVFARDLALSPCTIKEDSRLSMFHLRKTNSPSFENVDNSKEKADGACSPPTKRLCRSSLDSQPIKLQLKLRNSTDTKDLRAEVEELERSTLSPLEQKPKVISSSDADDQEQKTLPSGEEGHDKPKVISSSVGGIREDQNKHSPKPFSNFAENVPDGKDDIQRFETCSDIKKESSWPLSDGTVSSPKSKWRHSLDDISSFTLRHSSRDGKELGAKTEDGHSATDRRSSPTCSSSCYPDTVLISPSRSPSSIHQAPECSHRSISSPSFSDSAYRTTSPCCSQDVVPHAINSPSSSPVRRSVSSADTPWNRGNEDFSAEPGKVVSRRSSESSAILSRDEELTSGEDAWPVWVYCSRYSARPSSGPRSRRQPKRAPSSSSPDEKRSRTAFTSSQLTKLRAEFEASAYLSETRRVALASQLGLSEAQIKIWFQNRRAKVKRAAGERNPLAQKLMEHGLYNHSTHKTD